MQMLTFMEFLNIWGLRYRIIVIKLICIQSRYVQCYNSDATVTLIMMIMIIIMIIIIIILLLLLLASSSLYLLLFQIAASDFVWGKCGFCMCLLREERKNEICEIIIADTKTTRKQIWHIY